MATDTRKTWSRQQQAGSESGFLLLEALLSMVLLALLMHGITQMLLVGLVVDSGAGHLTTSTALATAKMEELRNTDYATLAVGGSMTTNVTGFFDEYDVDADGVNDVVRRWTVADLGSSKRLSVAVVSIAEDMGASKATTLVSLMAP